MKSINNIKVSDTIQKQSDSVTEKKVVKVITKIKFLTKFIDRLKIEKLIMSKELKISKENVRIDTVFIETKKSFWGKSKTTVTGNTETQNIETVDSTSTQKVLDTIK
jgi:hypothetical protein